MDTSDTDQPNEPGWYEIRLQGRLAPRWSAWFDGMNLTPDTDGTTVLYGPVVDQAALHGLLTRLRDLGLPLISVARAEPDQREHQAQDTTNPDNSTGE